jgi:hypothetical protein
VPAAGKEKPAQLRRANAGNRDHIMNNSISKTSGIGNASDTVTVLKVGSDKAATKTFRWNGNVFEKVGDFDAGMWFGYETHAITNICDLSSVLTVIEEAQDSFIIRGRLNNDAPSNVRVRRMKNPDEDGHIWFEEQSRFWLMLDIDKVVLPDWADPVNDPERIAKHLINLLPKCFKEVTCHWQMSSSAGVKSNTEARAHLWFWLDRPLGQDELKRWSQEFEIDVDALVFGTVQPLYVAKPIFVGGEDPVPRRSGLLRGVNDVVAAPDIDMAVKSKAIGSVRSDGGTFDFSAAPGYENKIACLGNGEGLGGFNEPLTSAIASYASEHGDDFDREALKADLRRRIDEAPKAPGREAEMARYKSGRYLDSSIEGAIRQFAQSKLLPPLYHPPEGDLKAARELLRNSLEKWRAATIQYYTDLKLWEARMKEAKQIGSSRVKYMRIFDPKPVPPVHGIEAGTGIGKSFEMRNRLPELIEHLDPGHCILIVVPDHKLSAEMATEIASMGISVAIYRGLSAIDPDAPEFKMCRIARQAEEFRRGGGKLSKLCEGCPHASDCGHQRQLGLDAQVWIGAHNLLFHPRKMPIPPVDYVIVDESPINAGLAGFSRSDMLAVTSTELRRRAKKGDESLGEKRNRLADAIDNAASSKYLTLKDLTHLTGSDASEARKLVFQEMEEVSADCHEKPRARRRQVAIEKRNHRRLIEAEIWLALGGVEDDGPIPGLRIENDGDDEGSPERQLRLWQRRKVHKEYYKPTLIMDATPQWDVYRKYWRIDRLNISTIEAALPFVSFRQVTWSASASKLLADDKTAEGNRGKMLRYIESRAAFHSRVLVLCQKGLEEWLRDNLPENVQISHFNAVRGQDRWKDVDCLILIGRTQPPPSEVEMRAEVLFSEIPDSLAGEYYQRKEVGLSVTGNPRRNCVDLEYHPDIKPEMIRWLACEAELIQSVGRARGVNRTAESPLQIDIVGIVPLPFEFDEVLRIAEAKPDPLDIMAGRGVVLDCEPSAKGAVKAMAAILPDLYGSADSAKSARRRSRCQTPNKEYLLSKRHRERLQSENWRSYRYRPFESRYSVTIKVRRCLWRPLRDGEEPPANVQASKLGGIIYVKEPLVREEYRDTAGYIMRN